MSIQFDCVACGKRIEIDDAWGGRLVECPYCHDTITAPAYSTGAAPSDPQNDVGAARPGTVSDSASNAEPARPYAPTPPNAGSYGTPAFDPSQTTPWPQVPVAPHTRDTNKLAIVALVLACVSILLGIAAMIPIIGAISNNLGMDATAEEINAFFEKSASEAAPWMIKVTLFMLAGFGMWVAGLVCALLAVRRKVLRGVAIAALVVLGFPIGLFLLSLA